jgi:hypothetical protein
LFFASASVPPIWNSRAARGRSPIAAKANPMFVRTRRDDGASRAADS